MSKKIPALRFHGNQVAGYRHIRRGLVELFITQGIQERTGVPVLKRTVEISDHTSITVHISGEQDIIHITSNPPSLPEIIPPLEEKEEIELLKCPSAFQIRYLNVNTSLDAYKKPGYLIGYNHEKKKWQIVSYKNKFGGTEPLTGNLGWYHAKTKPAGLYNRCDVVTWNGQSTPDFCPTGLHEITGRAPHNKFIRPVFFFQGREIMAPNNVVGACILEDKVEGKDIDFFYVHCADLQSTDFTGGGTKSLVCTDVIYRAPVAEAMSEEVGDPDWIEVGRFLASDFIDILSFSILAPSYQKVAWFEKPASTDYVDANGFAYCTRTYIGMEFQGWFAKDGCNITLKVNMRDGTCKVLGHTDEGGDFWTSSASTYGDTSIGGSWFGLVLGDSEESWGGHYNGSYDNSSKPHIFYIFPGTQDLYYLALRATAATSMSISVPPVEDDSYPGSGQFYENTILDIVVYKNGQEIDFIPWYEKLAVSSWAYSGGHIASASTLYYENTKWVYEYHPEIPGCKNYFEHRVTGSNGGASEEIIWTRGDESEVVRYAEQAGTTTRPDWPYRTVWPFAEAGNFEHVDIDPAHSGQFWLHWLDLAEDINGSPFRLADPGTNSWEFGSPLYSNIYTYPYGRTFDKAFRPQLGNAGLGLFDGALSKPQEYHCYGSAQSFYYQVNPPDIDNFTGTYCGAAYAIHRPVKGGEKPYLWLQRKHNLNTVIQSAPSLSLHIYLAEGDPATVPHFFYDTALWKDFWWLWNYPLGSIQDLEEDEDGEFSHWNDEHWVLHSNVASAHTLNAMTKETGNAFFNIGIL